MSDKPVVVVTGGSGYVASRIVHDLRITQKYQVRTTVRNPSDSEKVQFLKDYGDVQIAQGDLVVDGSFDQAFEGAKYVIHTASPFFLGSKDPENELYKPAIEGTKNVLRSCLKNGVKRVVLTSSTVAVKGGQKRRDPAHIWVEEDWNNDALEANSSSNSYMRSKTLAEIAAWDFVSQHPEIELVVINPGFVLGPPLLGRLDPTSIQVPKLLIEGGYNPIPNYVYSTVDVRAVSQAHIKGLETDKPNQRFIVANADETSFFDLAQIVKKLHPDWPVSTTPSPNVKPTLKNSMNNSRAREVLGVEFYDLEVTLKDMYTELIKFGVVKKPV